MLAILLLSRLKVLTIAAFFMTLPNLMEFICGKILCLKIVDIYTPHFRETNFENSVYNYNLMKTKQEKNNPSPPPRKKKKEEEKQTKIETKNVLLVEKNNNNSNIYVTLALIWGNQ